MSGIVVTGYASLDHVVVLDGDVCPGKTTTILNRPAGAWPRLGGGPAYVAQSVGRYYQGSVAPISWIGVDAQSDLYLDRLRNRGISTDGVVKITDARTPVSVLAYDHKGDCSVLYDPGLPDTVTLNDGQSDMVRNATWVAMTIGPRAVTDQVLTLIRTDQKLAWVVKNDPRALTPDQSAALVVRADVIFCNERERLFLDNVATTDRNARKDQLVVETQGRRGATFIRNGERCLVAAEPVDVIDPTGSGDTFAGGVIAAIMNGETDLKSLGQAGNAAARALLLERQSEEIEGR